MEKLDIDQIKERAQQEAEDCHPERKVFTFDSDNEHAIYMQRRRASVEAYAAALIAERTKQVATDIKVNELITCAQALVDRWETPSWKDTEHTAVFINKLRNTVSDIKNA